MTTGSGDNSVIQREPTMDDAGLLPGQVEIDRCASTWKTRTDWERRAAYLRRELLASAGLYPWPAPAPLSPIWRPRLDHDGYTVQPVGLESMPGFYCVGDLYRPTGYEGRRPAIIRAHGHTSIGRYGVQPQCAAMARMGAVVLAISMVGYNDSRQYGNEHSPDNPPGPAIFGLQLLNLIRSMDFLSTLPDVIPENINITGESGGGTQTFMLSAVDSRVNVSIPVVMVSAPHVGCRCEEGGSKHVVPRLTNHAEVAALHAPRPLLVISCGGDWTQYVPQVEFPYITSVYEVLGVGAQVENAHLSDEGHDYGPSKRSATYAFLLKHGVLQGEPDERITPDSDDALSVFNDKRRLAETALASPAAIEEQLNKLTLTAFE